MSKFVLKNNTAFWHAYMKYSGLINLYKLRKNCLKVNL